MKIGDEVIVHGYVDEIRNDVVIIRNDGGYFGTIEDEVICVSAAKFHKEHIEPKVVIEPTDEPQKWTKENCKGCKYNEYPYDSGTCFVRVCINGNKYELQTDCAWK